LLITKSFSILQTCNKQNGVPFDEINLYECLPPFLFYRFTNNTTHKLPLILTFVSHYK